MIKNKNFVPKITKEEFEKLQPRCGCPYHELLEWKEHYKHQGIPRFKYGHHTRKRLDKISKEEFDILQPRCACPCNKLIPWIESYKYRGIPKFIKGHYLPFIQKGNPSFFKGKKHSVESRCRISKSNKGRVSSFYGKKHTDTTKYKLSEKAKQRTGERNPFYGKHHTEETKSILKMKNSGKPSPMKGKHISDEAKTKISIKNKGRKRTDEVKQKMRLNRRNQLGENNSMWKGGISFYPYCKKFNNYTKELIRNRDNRLCQLCNKTEIENKQKQTVHHIHYDKENCEPDLICLCRSCNSKVNANRDFWEELFTFMLWIKGMLYWKPT